MATARYIPDFQVIHVKGPIFTTKRVWEREVMLDDDGKPLLDDNGKKRYKPGTFKDVEVKLKEAWDVYHPRGHCVRVTKKSELERMGFDKEPPVTDHLTGLRLEGTQEALDLAEVARATRLLNRFKRGVTGAHLGVPEEVQEAE